MASTYKGTTGNDNFVLQVPGTFSLDGLAGEDTLALGTALRSQYTLKQVGTAITIDSVTGASSALHATLYNIEIVTFNSGRDVVDLRTFFSSTSIAGTSADDTLQLPAGTMNVDGLSGVDTAVIAGASNAYTLSSSQATFKLVSTDQTSSYTFSNVEKLQFSDRTVIIESQVHGSYADLPSELYQFFITAFNAAPGVTYMDQLAEAYRYGLTVKQIVDIFTTKKQFTDVYSPSLNHEDMATQLVNNIVKDSASANAKAEAILDIKGALDLGWTVGEVIYTVFGNLAHKSPTDPTWGSTGKQFNNEIAVAKYYTEVLNQSTTDLETLRDAIQPVTQSTDVSSDAVIAQLIGVALLTGGTGPVP
jgi:hypothetical protein